MPSKLRRITDEQSHFETSSSLLTQKPILLEDCLIRSFPPTLLRKNGRKAPTRARFLLIGDDHQMRTALPLLSPTLRGTTPPLLNRSHHPGGALFVQRHIPFTTVMDLTGRALKNAITWYNRLVFALVASVKVMTPKIAARGRRVRSVGSLTRQFCTMIRKTTRN